VVGSGADLSVPALTVGADSKEQDIREEREKMTSDEAAKVVRIFNHRSPNVAEFEHAMIYGPDYERGTTESVMDALHALDQSDYAGVAYWLDMAAKRHAHKQARRQALADDR